MKKAPRSKTAHDVPLAEEFTTAIRTLGDYAHVNVRPHRGLLYIYADERDDLDDPDDAIARLHPSANHTYTLSFHNHTGRWEPMPFSGNLTRITATLVDVLAPYLAKWEKAPGTSRAAH